MNIISNKDKPKKNPYVFIGKYTDEYSGEINLIEDSVNDHIAILGPARSGKTAGFSIPAAFTWSESMVINDMRGQIFTSTSWYRKNKLGQNIFKFDPLSEDGSSIGINVLDFVRIYTHYDMSDAQNIAKMLCDPQGLGLDSDRWRKSSYAFLTGVLLHHLYARDIEYKYKNLTGIYEFLSNFIDDFENLSHHMLTYEHDPEMKCGWKNFEGKVTKIHPMVTKTIKDMMDLQKEERESILSSTKSYLSLYTNPAIARNIACSDMSFEDLMDNDKAATLYIVNHPKDMELVRPLVRLIINSIVTKLTSQVEFENNAAKKSHKHELLMLMDDFTKTLGKMDVFVNTLSFLSFYGIKVVAIDQDIKNLRDYYGKDTTENLLANLSTHINLENMSSTYENKFIDSDQIISKKNKEPLHCKKIVYFKEEIFKEKFKSERPVEISNKISKQDQAFRKYTEFSSD